MTEIQETLATYDWEWLHNLSAADQALLRQIGKAMCQPIQMQQHSQSTIFDKRFGEAFAGYLRTWHFFNSTPLIKKTFEYALIHCFEATGREGRIESNPVSAGYDIELEKVRYSCKTQGGKLRSEFRGHISKMFEARWIRDCAGDRDLIAEKLAERFNEHTSKYKSILMLRALQETRSDDVVTVRYSLFELPQAMFEGVKTLRGPDFTKPQSASSGCSARVHWEGEDVATIGVDGSVEKITVGRINLRRAIHHFTWEFSLDAG